MKAWKEYSIGEITEVVGGGTPSTSNPEYWNGDISWITPADLSKNKEKYFKKGERSITVKGLKESSTRLLPKGTVLLSSRAPIGYLAIADNEICTNQGFKSLICKEKLINNEFLYYFLLLQRDYLETISSGATFPELSGSTLKQFKLLIPPFSTQQRIASILSAYDDLIETNNERIKLLEESARELYKEWFVRMRFPGYKDAKFVKGIPEGWEVVRIDKLYKTSSGGTPLREKNEYYENGIYEWIKTGELNDSFIFNTKERISELGLKNSSAKLFPPKTVIFAMYGNTIGQLGITTKEAATNQACCALLPLTNEFDYEFIFLTLLENRNEIISFGMGAAQQNVSQDEIKKYQIIKPTKELSLKFKTIVSPIFEQIEIHQQQNTQLRQIRDRLLPRLISGKLEVN